jgi:macrolide transport system ATP-binding/permease protein
LGVESTLGRVFHEGGARLVREQVCEVVLSHRFWKNRLDGDTLVRGKILRLNGKPCTVIGVTPSDFLGASPFLFPADIWMTITAGSAVAPELADNALERRDVEMFFVAGRLKPGVTFARAETELDAVARQFDRDRVGMDLSRKDRRVLLVEGGKLFPLRKQDLPFFTSFLGIMAALIMLIACMNVANMMLARATRRRREIAIRLALGASRSRLIRQLLTESIILALSAGALGFAGCARLMQLSSQMRMPFPMPVAFDFRPDWRVLVLSLALSLITGLVFGLAPALQATKADIGPSLKEGASTFLAGRRRLSFRNLLIVSQVAGSLTLLVVLGFLSIGIQTTLGIQTGFNSRNLYTIGLDPVRDGFTGAQSADFLSKLIERVKKLPSVTAAALTETVPVSMPGGAVTVSTLSAAESRTLKALKHVVGKDYFNTAGIPIPFGRAFGMEDETERSATVVVSETLARELWGGANAVGRTLEIRNGEIGPPKILPGSFDYRPTVSGAEVFQVVGVAGNVAEGLGIGKPRPSIYFPLTARNYAHPSLQGITMMVRATPGADALGLVRREIRSIDERVMPFNGGSMSEQIDRFMAPLQIAAWTYGLIGVFGLVLACVGLTGVTAYSVAQRTREIGIRIALGARNLSVLSLVMKEGLVLVAVGTIIGMGGAWMGSRLLAAMNATVGTVSSTSTSNPVVLFGAPLLLAMLAVLACYLPARRSVHVDPIVALRQE